VQVDSYLSKHPDKKRPAEDIKANLASGFSLSWLLYFNTVHRFSRNLTKLIRFLRGQLGLGSVPDEIMMTRSMKTNLTKKMTRKSRMRMRMRTRMRMRMRKVTTKRIAGCVLWPELEAQQAWRHHMAHWFAMALTFAA
jgi:hypothetical protein